MTPRASKPDFRTASTYLTGWQQRHSGLAADAELATMRHDLQILLSFVRDSAVVGTQGTGNMRLKDVWAVTSQFAHPPQLEVPIGDKVYLPRSEADVRPLHFLRILAEVGGLLKTARSRRWTVTRQGKGFLASDSLLQCAFALSVWWHTTNWLVVYPYEGMGDSLPYGFTEKSLVSLLGLTPGKSVRFSEYANELIHWTGLTWKAPESRIASSMLQTSIEMMILRVMEGFGGTILTYKKDGTDPFPQKELTEFSITPLGRALLEALVILGPYPPHKESEFLPIGLN